MTETSYLILSVGLYFLMIIVQAIFSDREHGVVGNAGPRDNHVDKTLSVQRAKRANQNMNEGLMMFVPLILIAIQSGQTTSLTLIGSAMFFWGRLAYAPLYWFGVPWLRSIAWFISIGGIVLIFITLFSLI